jgi:hypothetical protein
VKLSDGQRKTLNLLDQWAQQEDASRTGAAKVRHSERLREIRQELENQATGGGRLAGVDMAADDNGQMLLLSLRGGGEEGRSQNKEPVYCVYPTPPHHHPPPPSYSIPQPCAAMCSHVQPCAPVLISNHLPVPLCAVVDVARVQHSTASNGGTAVMESAGCGHALAVAEYRHSPALLSRRYFTPQHSNPR